jgi:hypothetical protein
MTSESPTNQRDEVSEETQHVEDDDAKTPAHADRPPTSEEELAAEETGPLSESVASHEREMAELGAKVKGEGEITPSS